jgi:nucleotide-binding universal stress UspA family protein
VAIPESNDELKQLVEAALVRHDLDLIDRLDELLGVLPAELRGRSVVLPGAEPVDLLVRSVSGYDLLVVGTHGRRGMAHARYGSVAELVVRSSAVPVLVVRNVRETAGLRVLAAVDVFDEEAASLVAEAAVWAARIGARLDVIHVVPAAAVPDLGLASHHIWAKSLEALVDQIRARADRLVATGPEPVRGDAGVELGDPATTIASLSSVYAAVVVRTHGRHGLGRLCFGSVSEHVVRLAEGPVLVLPPASRVGVRTVECANAPTAEARVAR